jgi:CBS domain containing-hemolysin-like protein
LDTFVEDGHSRLPVYQGSKDNIIGIVYARDLHYILRYKELFLLQDLINEPYFVSSEAKVNDVLKKFQADKIQIAIVVNEHKKAVGLVTLEDLMEEIVGEIEEKTSLSRVKK